MPVIGVAGSSSIDKGQRDGDGDFAGRGHAALCVDGP